MPRLTIWMVRLALIYLGLGLTAGSVMLWNKGLPFDPGVWRYLRPHVEMMMIGWTVQLILGVAFWILPRFSYGPKYGNERLAWIAAIIFNAGVLAAVAGLTANEETLALVGRVLEAAGVVLFAAQVWPRVRSFNTIVSEHHSKGVES